MTWFQTKDFASLIGCGNRTTEFVSDAHDLLHEFAIRLGKHALREVEVILEAHADVTAHGDGSGGHREGMTTYAGDGPSGASGDAVH